MRGILAPARFAERGPRAAHWGIPWNDGTPQFTPLKPNCIAAEMPDLLEVSRGRRKGLRLAELSRGMFGPATILASAVCPSQLSGTRRNHYWLGALFR